MKEHLLSEDISYSNSQNIFFPGGKKNIMLNFLSVAVGTVHLCMRVCVDSMVTFYLSHTRSFFTSVLEVMSLLYPFPTSCHISYVVGSGTFSFRFSVLVVLRGSFLTSLPSSRSFPSNFLLSRVT